MVAVSEEQALWAQYSVSGSPEIREKLVLQAVPLVYFIMGRLGITREVGTDYEDLAHQGMLGLIDAVDRYDVTQGTRFSTYAGIRIRGKIIDYLRSNDWMSRSSRKRARRIQNGVSDFWSEKHHEPTDAELAGFLGMDIDEVQQGLLDTSRVMVSLDLEPAGNSDEDVSLYETQADENQTDPSELCFESDQKEQLMNAIRQLPEREQLVLSLYYFEELNFKEIGKVLDVSESRVCQLHTRAILNIKAILKNE